MRAVMAAAEFQFVGPRDFGNIDNNHLPLSLIVIFS